MAFLDCAVYYVGMFSFEKPTQKILERREEHSSRGEEEPAKDWREYFPEGYTDDMKEYFSLHQNENDPEITKALNASVENLLQIRSEVQGMGFDSFESLEQFRSEVSKKIPTLHRPTNDFNTVYNGMLLNDDNRSYPGQDTLSFNERSKDALSFLVDYFVAPSPENLVRQHIEGVFSSLVDKGYYNRGTEYFSNHRSPMYFLSTNKKELWLGDNGWEQTYQGIDELIINRTNVCVVAPRSALDTARILQSAMKYIASTNEEIEAPFFTFPGKKIRGSELKDLLSNVELKNVLLRNRDINDAMEDIKKNDQYDDAKKEELCKLLQSQVEVMQPIINAIERQVKSGNEEVRVAVYDESINTGYTQNTLSHVVHVCFKFLEEKYPGIKTPDVQKVPPNDPNGLYRLWSHGGYKTGRGENEPLERFSFEENPVDHRLSILINTIAGLLGKQFGDTWNLIYHLEYEGRIENLKRVIYK